MYNDIFISRPKRRLMFSILLVFILSIKGFAHPMPNSVVLLDIQPKQVLMELQLPLNELELAFGHDVNKNPLGLLNRLRPELSAYLLSHIHPISSDGSGWIVKLYDLQVQQVQQSPSGPYFELTADLMLTPPAGYSTREFILNYDIILHQVATHFALISVRQDWEGGVLTSEPIRLGVIDWDIRNNVIHPFKVSLGDGGTWQGFKQTAVLGMHHIAEGTDHLLFLLVLLLAAPLLTVDGKWGTFGGVRYSLARLLKIVTAFTIGHSVTLVAGALAWFSFPGQPVEVLIAFSIFISAFHAVRPVFSGNEAYVAAGFGLIHGMAFAGTLVDLNLNSFQLGMSILGFNLGIELMQLLVIAVVFPWLMILSRTKLYSPLRIGGALLSAAAATGWIIERITSKPNVITTIINDAAGYALWILVTLAVMAILSLFTSRGKTQLG